MDEEAIIPMDRAFVEAKSVYKVITSVASERPLSQTCYFRSGSGRDGPQFKFVAGKRSLGFRFPEAAIRHRVLGAQSCRSN